MKKILVGLTALAMQLFLAASGYGVTMTIFTDKAAWSQAAGGQFATETFADNVLHDPGLTYTTVMGSIALERWRDVLNVTSSHPAMTTWQFNPSVTAYGGTWTLGGPGGSGNSLVVSLPEYGLTVGRITSSYYGDFWGFVTDTPFSQVRLQGGTGSNQRMYFLDDMVYGGGLLAAANSQGLVISTAMVATPVPPSVWLLGGALLVIWRRRRP